VTRNAESALLVLAALLTGAGAALVTVTMDDTIMADAALAPAVFLAGFGGLLIAVRRWASGSVRTLLPLVALLTAVGWIEIYRIDRQAGRLQLAWILLGTTLAGAVLFLLRRRGVEVLRRYRYMFLVAGLGLLLLPLLPQALPLHGVTINGSRLWVRLDAGSASFSLQPGEAAKLLIVAFLASYLADRHRGLADMPRRLGPLHVPEPRQLLPIFLAFGVSFLVLVYQRDLGASLLLFAVFATMLYAATARPTYLIASAALVAGGGLAAAQSFSHVQVRVEAWLHPFADFTGTGYQIAQGLFALGSGGLTGAGFGAGSPDLIPAASTDYIFVAIAEELGLAGGLAVLAAFGLVISIGFGIAMRAGDAFRKLLAAGLTLTLGVQTLLILAGVIRLFPVTGITLPFMSYGGSSLLANLVLIAVLVRISHEERV